MRGWPVKFGRHRLKPVVCGKRPDGGGKLAGPATDKPIAFPAESGVNDALRGAVPQLAQALV